MKTTTRVLSILVVLALLAGCAPAPAPTLAPTAIPTATFSPPPTAAPTPEPEPTPTAKVEIPLEQLPVTIAAATEFANAMTAAGTPITAEQVLQQGFVITEIPGIDGKKYEVAKTQDGFPLMIKGDSGIWEKVKLSTQNQHVVAVTTHIEPSTEFWKESGFWVTGGETGKFVADNYSGVIVPFFWHQIYNTGETGDYNLSKAYVKLAEKISNPNLIGGSLLYGEFVPDWLKSMPKEKQHQVMLDKIAEMMITFPQIKNWIVVNEPNSFGDYWYKTFGKQYIIDAFKKGREINPTANLILNGLDLDQTTNLQNISNEDSIIPLIRDLKDQGLIDQVGIEAHIDASKKIPSENELIAYFKTVKEKTGVPVRLSELDVDIRSLSGSDRLQKQASIYETVVRAYIKSEAGSDLNLWGIKDKDSWRENTAFGGVENADADLFDDQGNPKIAYYAVLKALFGDTQP